MNNKKSVEIYEEAVKYIPGGVNSPVRAFKSVGLSPIFIDKAKGSKIYDVDGNEYIDYICSWGPLMLGHSNEMLLEGIEDIIRRGTSYGVPTEIEVKMAKLIVEAYPSVEMVRMVNSGTEATMSALRAARAYTKRNKILKFEGCYHGHSDALLVKSGSGTITYGVPTSPGVPADVVKDTLVCRYNDIDEVKSIFKECGNEIAAIIVEPVAGNMGVVTAKEGFLQGLRDITEEYGAVLIFDEVITGFRLSYGGAQEVYNIKPDMTCFGKIIGAGLPVGAYGGKKEIMELISPMGPVYQAGTLSGNPLAMHMGYKNITTLRDNKDIYTELENKAKRLEEGLRANLQKLDIKGTVNRAGSLVCMFFAEGPINDYDDVMKCDVEKFNIYFSELIKKGVLLAPTQFEAMFLSNAHTNEDIDYTINASFEAMKTAYNK